MAFEMLDQMLQLHSLIKGDQEQRRREAEIERRQQLEFTRSLALSYVDLYERAPTLAYKEHYQRMLSGITQDLSPEDRTALMPLVVGTPLDPTQQKLVQYERAVGPRPQFPTTYQENPNLYAETLFVQQEYDARRKHFMTGEQPALKRIIGLPDGQFAIKDKDTVGIYSAEELRTEGEAKKYGSSLNEIALNDGIVRGKPYRMVLQGKEYEVTPQMDLIKKRRLEPIIIETPGQLQRDSVTPKQEDIMKARRLDKDQQALLDAFATKSDKSALFTMFEDKVSGHGNLTPQRFAELFLRRHFPGYEVFLSDVKKDSSIFETLIGANPGDNYVMGDEFAIRLVWGKRGLTNKGKKIIFDPELYLLYDENGALVKDPASFVKEQGGFALGDALWEN